MSTSTDGTPVGAMDELDRWLATVEVETASRSCQRWADGRVPKWTLAEPGEEFDARDYEVKVVDRATAKAFVTARHYSGSHVACRLSFGLYRAKRLVGVAAYCVTSEAALRLAFPELTPGSESLELGRLVLDEAEPGNTEWYFVRRCHALLYEAGVVAVMAFADPVPRIVGRRVFFAGHVGYVYQAGGLVRAGRSVKRTQWQMPDGTYFNGVTMQKIRTQRSGCEAAERRLVEVYGARPRRAGEKPATWLRDAVRDDPDVGVTLVRHGGCHRYLGATGGTSRLRRRVKITRKLRADWADVVDPYRRDGDPEGRLLTITAAPWGPYPKAPDLVVV